jgi:hypothetical protein
MKEEQKLYLGRSILEAYECTKHIDHWNARKSLRNGRPLIVIKQNKHKAFEE